MRGRQLATTLKVAFPHGLPFRKFSPRPIAVGSIAQVHRAELKSGAHVIVKLLRPGLQREIDRDLNAAELLCDFVLTLPGLTSKTTPRALSTRSGTAAPRCAPSSLSA